MRRVVYSSDEDEDVVATEPSTPPVRRRRLRKMGEAALTPPTQAQAKTPPLSGHKRPTPRVRRLVLPEDDGTDTSADLQDNEGARKRSTAALDDDEEVAIVCERTREERTAQGILEAINLVSSEDEDAGSDDEEVDEVDGVCPVCECAWA